LNAEQNSFGVIIDEVLDSADIVVKPLNRLLKSLQVYSGATVLGDGSVALIFDVLGISTLAHMGLEK
jgi:two-component system, chemotaxis family, sensor kinase CheA